MNIISSFGWQLTFHLPLHVLVNTAAGVIDLSNLSIARGPMYEDVKKYLVMTGHPETSTIWVALCAICLDIIGVYQAVFTAHELMTMPTTGKREYLRDGGRWQKRAAAFAQGK